MACMRQRPNMRFCFLGPANVLDSGGTECQFIVGCHTNTPVLLYHVMFRCKHVGVVIEQLHLI